METNAACLRDAAVEYTYVAAWIALSGGVILFNKWVLFYMPFPYPLSLTMMHMAFCSVLAAVLINGFKVVNPVSMTRTQYVSNVLPIGVLFSISLWLSNSAYLYISVAFIQMLKAFMPVVVYFVAVAFKLETWSNATLVNMVVVTTGVAIAADGELNFVMHGVLLQLGAIFAEALRLALVQILLNSKGLGMNALTSLYYVSPACFVCLSIPWMLIELPHMMSTEEVKFDALIFLANCTVAFALNIAVYLLIGKTSALTMNVAGVLKDWLLIGLSALLFASPISTQSLLGYLLAFSGVCYYNYKKMQAKAQASKAPPGEQQGTKEALAPAADEERGPSAPLLTRER